MPNHTSSPHQPKGVHDPGQTPRRRFRILRHHTKTAGFITYLTATARNAAAQQWADHDGHPIITERWDASHPHDAANRGWAMDGLVTPQHLTITLHFINVYELYGTFETTATVTIPVPPSDASSNAYADWVHEHIYAETGTGRTAGNATYFVHITASTIADLIGREFDFGL